MSTAVIETNGTEDSTLRTVTRSFTFKVLRDDGEQLELLNQLVTALNDRARAVMSFFALVLGWIADLEEQKQIRSWLRANFPETEKLLDRPLDCEAVRGYVFSLVLCGARAWDPFRGFSSATKLKFGSAEKVLNSLIEERRKALERLHIAAREAEPNLPKDPSIARIEYELLELEVALSLMARLSADSSFRPAKPLLDEISDGCEIYLQKLVVEAACQRLLGHHELVLLYRAARYQIVLEEFQAKKSEEYLDYLAFRREHADLFDSFSKAPRKPESFAQLLRDPRIRLFRKDETTDAELADLKFTSQLRDASPAIAWFSENHALWSRFRREEAKKPPTLTFIDHDRNPFHFTLPGPRTKAGYFEIRKSPSKKAPGTAVVRVSLDGSNDLATLSICGRADFARIEPADNDADRNQLWFREQGSEIRRRAWLGGLRIRPQRDGLYLDLTVNLEADSWSERAQALAFDKEAKAWQLPVGMTAASFVAHDNGSLWMVRAQWNGEDWKVLTSRELTYPDFRWPKLEAVKIREGERRRTVQKYEFGKLVQAYQCHRHQKGSMNVEALVRVLSQAVPGADRDTLRVLEQHLEQRNNRAAGIKPSSPLLRKFDVGTLRELEVRISSLVSRICELKESRDKSDRRQKSRLIEELKSTRSHALSSRDNRVKVAAHEVGLFLTREGESPVDLLLLPNKPPKDFRYQRSAAARGADQNRLIGLCRTGDLCDRIEDIAQLLGVRVLRTSTAKTTAVCPSPKCDCKWGLVLAQGVSEATGKTCLLAPTKKRSTKSNGSKKGPRQLAPLPKPRRFACPSCGYNGDQRHVEGLNMLSRLAVSGFGVIPEGTTRPKPAEILKAICE